MPLTKAQQDKAFNYWWIMGAGGLSMKSYSSYKSLQPDGYSKKDHQAVIDGMRANLVEYKRLARIYEQDKQRHRQRAAALKKRKERTLRLKKQAYLRRIRRSGISIAQRRETMDKMLKKLLSEGFLRPQVVSLPPDVRVVRSTKEFRDRYASQHYSHSRGLTPFYEWLERLGVDVRLKAQQLHEDIDQRTNQVWDFLEEDEAVLQAISAPLGDMPYDNILLQARVIAIAAELPRMPTAAKRLLWFLQHGMIACGVLGKDERKGFAVYVPKTK